MKRELFNLSMVIIEDDNVHISEKLRTINFLIKEMPLSQNFKIFSLLFPILKNMVKDKKNAACHRIAALEILNQIGAFDEVHSS